MVDKKRGAADKRVGRMIHKPNPSCPNCGNGLFKHTWDESGKLKPIWNCGHCGADYEAK